MNIDPGYAYCDQSDIWAILGQQGEQDRLDDDASGFVTSAQQAYETKSVIAWATGRIDMYCQPLYKSADLVGNAMTNYWCVILAAQMLCSRRGNPVATSINEQAKQVMLDLDMVRKGNAQIPNVAYSDVGWPAWSNVRVDPSYRLKQTRVQRPISERTQTPYPQNIDRGSEVIIEF